MKTLPKSKINFTRELLQSQSITGRGEYIQNLLKNYKVPKSLFKEIVNFLINSDPYEEQIEEINIEALAPIADKIGYTFTEEELESLLSWGGYISVDLIEKNPSLLDSLLKATDWIELEGKISKSLEQYILENIEEWKNEEAHLELLLGLNLSNKIKMKMIELGYATHFQDWSVMIPKEGYPLIANEIAEEDLIIRHNLIPKEYQQLHKFLSGMTKTPPTISKERFIRDFSRLLTSGNRPVREWAGRICTDKYLIQIGTQEWKISRRVKDKLLKLLKFPEEEVNKKLLEALK